MAFFIAKDSIDMASESGAFTTPPTLCLKNA